MGEQGCRRVGWASAKVAMGRLGRLIEGDDDDKSVVGWTRKTFYIWDDDD